MPKRAFTIIELLVSITIIGLLLGAVALNVNSSQANKRDAQRIGDITMIAKALDASTLTTRGIYPGGTETIADTEATFCASDIDPSKLDLTSFPGNRIPKDPRPTGGLCDGGYVYYLNKKEVSNLASELQVSYVLEVGLEKDKISDEKNLKTAEEVGLNPDDYQGRYFLTGSYCGDSCPSRLLIEMGDQSVVDNPGGETFSPLTFNVTASDIEGTVNFTSNITISGITGGDASKPIAYTVLCGENNQGYGPTSITYTNSTTNPCSYTVAGPKTVTITLQQAGMADAVKTIVITANAAPLPPLSVTLSASPSSFTGTVSVSSPFIPTMTATPSPSGAYSYAFQCDNGQAIVTTTNATSTPCKFTEYKTYSVSLSATAADGRSTSGGTSITITAPPAAISNPFRIPMGIAFDENRNRAYVANYYSNWVTVVDTGSNTAFMKIDTGSATCGVGVASTKGFAYVTNCSVEGAKSNYVTVINTQTNTVVKKITVNTPEFVAMSHDDNYAYISSNRSITVINTTTNLVDRVVDLSQYFSKGSGGYVDYITSSPTSNLLYMISYNSSTAVIFDPSTDTVTKTISGFDGVIRQISISQDGKFIYTVRNNIYQDFQGSVSVYVNDAITGAYIKKITNVNDAGHAITSQDSRHVYISSYNSGSIVMVDALTGKTIKNIGAGSYPWNMGMTSDGNFIYVLHVRGNDSISIIRTSDNIVIKTIQ